VARKGDDPLPRLVMTSKQTCCHVQKRQADLVVPKFRFWLAKMAYSRRESFGYFSVGLCATTIPRTSLEFLARLALTHPLYMALGPTNLSLSFPFFNSITTRLLLLSTQSKSIVPTSVGYCRPGIPSCPEKVEDQVQAPQDCSQ